MSPHTMTRAICVGSQLMIIPSIWWRGGRTGRIEDRRRNCAAIPRLIWTHGWKAQPPGAVIGFLGVGQRRSGGS